MTPADLTTWRTRRGLSQRALAERLGVAHETVSRWELGRLPISTLLPLALRGIEAEDDPDLAILWEIARRWGRGA